MSSRTLTGSLLIAGTIVMVVAIIIIGSTFGNVDWGDPSEIIPLMAENAGMVKIVQPVFILGILMVAAGYAGLNHSMSGGSSAHYMRLGLMFYLIGATVVVSESALTVGMAEAASGGNQSAAEALYAASGSIGAVGESIRFLGLALIGFSIFTQRNLPVALGALMVVIGLIGVGTAVSSYQSNIMIVGYGGWIILTLATGILVLRSKD